MAGAPRNRQKRPHSARLHFRLFHDPAGEAGNGGKIHGLFGKKSRGCNITWLVHKFPCGDNGLANYPCLRDDTLRHFPRRVGDQQGQFLHCTPVCFLSLVAIE